MFKKKDIAIAMALAMTVSQPVLSQGESAATSTAEVPAASGPATGAPEAGTIGGVPVATAVAIGVIGAAVIASAVDNNGRTTPTPTP